MMKLNLLIVGIVVLLIITPINALSDSGTFGVSGSSSDSYVIGSHVAIASTDFMRLYFNDFDTIGTDVTQITVIVPKIYWSGSTASSYWENIDIVYAVGLIKKGYGIIGYNTGYHNGVESVFITLFITKFDATYTGGRMFNICYNGTTTSITGDIKYNRIANKPSGNNHVYFSTGSSQIMAYSNTTYNYDIEILNDYFFYDTDNYYYFNITSSTGEKGKINVTSNNDLIITESSYQTTQREFFIFDKSYSSWSIDWYSEFGHYDSLNINWDIIQEDICYIESNDIDIGDTLEIKYYNIDLLRENPLDYGYQGFDNEDLYIQLLINRGYYNELLKSELITNELNSSISYSSDNLQSGIYYIQINTLYRDSEKYAVRDTFLINQPANFSIRVNPSDVYVGDNVNIIYKALNQSVISVYDQDDTKIDTWINVVGQSQIVYQIPIDSNYNYNYTDWYVYLNDSGNSSNNLKYNFNVNWLVYIEPAPTIKIDDAYYNATIEENVKEIKEGVNPLLELVFGLSTIFVDNPDYNNDNIVDVNEISAWLNSLISICIIIFLFILYKVYNRK